MESKNIDPASNAESEDAPQYVYESLARCLLPVIQKYYKSEDGKCAFEEWKAKKEKHDAT
jgi:septum formation topological specificity factor MinE